MQWSVRDDDNVLSFSKLQGRHQQAVEHMGELIGAHATRPDLLAEGRDLSGESISVHIDRHYSDTTLPDRPRISTPSCYVVLREHQLGGHNATCLREGN